jgi:hypothetical protein
MSQKNNARHSSNCQITVKSAVIITDVNTPNVPMQKRKEDAEEILYLNRV